MGGRTCGKVPEVKPSLRSQSRDDLLAFLSEAGEPDYRAGQILHWVWKKRVRSVAAMSNLPSSLRAELEARFSLDELGHVRTQGAPDATRKFLFRLHDGQFIECVLVPASPALYGEPSDRRTLCVSSQVGCAFGCKFCASGLDGFTRNLTPDEIAGQVMRAEELTRQRVHNLVFMGMGEPLANLENLLHAIDLITAPWGLEIGARHLTVSTAGLVPQIRRLAAHPRQIRLAVSLHGATDEVRDLLLPINRRWPLEDLFRALHTWNEHKKQQITLEYILIEGVNDDLGQAALLARRARRIHAKVNLIPYNAVAGLSWRRPPPSHCRSFQDVLSRAGVRATLRIEKGHDIDAACGQLRLRQEKSREP